MILGPGLGVVVGGGTEAESAAEDVMVAWEAAKPSVHVIISSFHISSERWCYE